MAKQPKFNIGDIVSNKNGWRRKIIGVLSDYINEKGRYGYVYLSENYPELEFVYRGMCSEEHLRNWMSR